MGSGVTLELASVSKSFKKSPTIVEDINLSLTRGQVVALIGNSGSGKTTILQIAGLLDKPTLGVVTIDGVNCTQASNKYKTHVRRNFLSFVYQFHYLLQELSVLENVMLPQLIAGKSKAEAEKKSQAILEKFGLESKASSMVSEISGGERQRVAIARSIVNSPKLLLADEPTGNLDPTNSLNVFLLLHSYVKENNSSMLIVTHNYILAEEADHIFQLKNRSLVKL
ncbi:ABC transporter, ATP-binding protein [Wolbachia endosymbiont of Drosophila simulans wNo]|uniref:ABC transporter ATP-binding protein n=1 Tax=unclassified Wolbachia TaxID=2640676 RepID=UPI0002D25634|nr:MULTISPECIES: ABC transporter ATP-binding protein [unclassified Wolbachia]AGJ98905.1 ABC transporter, ATP-binding protein [Wolbachia endosymbiont of Drosophila simulans wNo]QCB63069.1 ABC transporter ATP-binding protein [Wolbachia endosymbiont of Drosophila mauritiana]QCB64114.1 ABC transporter ATP-binding protein [Wolbachia endosymbiont of Drosophila mauritiana]QWE33557.1 ABC transporter, ATP-binding protein [Wolbachia endosymbiont of Drosophila simulans]TGB05924.1 ABC transporter ATP-bind